MNNLQKKLPGEMRDYWVRGRSSSEQEKTSTHGYNAISISSGDFCATFGRSKVVKQFVVWSRAPVGGIPQRS